MSEQKLDDDQKTVVVLSKWKLYLLIGTVLVSTISQGAIALYRVSDHEVRIKTLETTAGSIGSLQQSIAELNKTIERFEKKLAANDNEILELWKNKPNK